MSFENILYQKEEGIATVTINRPAVRNALNNKTLLEIQSAIKDAENDEAVKVVIITGSGDRAFSSGADVNEFIGLTSFKAREVARFGQKIFSEIENLGKPVIAAINGAALGGGSELILACDFRIASEKAIFGQTEINLGILPAWGGTQRLLRLIGKARAKELIFTGKTIDAKEAERIGLINHCVPSDQLQNTVKEFAKVLMKKPPAALKLGKALIDKCSEINLEAALIHEADVAGINLPSPEGQEGLRAFLEKKEVKYR
jgi:enoyl-CoA hydratase